MSQPTSSEPPAPRPTSEVAECLKTIATEAVHAQGRRDGYKECSAEVMRRLGKCIEERERDQRHGTKRMAVVAEMEIEILKEAQEVCGTILWENVEKREWDAAVEAEDP
jgi:hypothetical protein